MTRLTNRQKLDRSRERRLWLGQIIMPTVSAVGAVMCVPEVRAAVVNKAKEIKAKVKSKLHKEQGA